MEFSCFPSLFLCIACFNSYAPAMIMVGALSVTPFRPSVRTYVLNGSVTYYRIRVTDAERTEKIAKNVYPVVIR